MIRNVVFDLGNVLLRFDPMAYLLKTYEDFTVAETLYWGIFRSEEWKLLDEGKITEEEALTRMENRLPQWKDDVRTLFTTWEYTVIEEMSASVFFLRRFKDMGYKLYALSNYPKRGYRNTVTQYDWFSLFDGQVISYEVKQVKPGRGIYETLFQRYGLKPEECLFVDDTLPNVEAAKALGMESYHYRSTDQLMDMLARLLQEKKENPENL